MKHKNTRALLFLAIVTLTSLQLVAQQTTVVKREWFIQNEKVDTIPITATVLDVSQNVITTGNAIVAGQSTNILTSKIAPDGTILWQQQLNGTANGKDFGTANCIDANGNIYVAGAVYDFTNNFDYIIACYDPNGNLQWQQTFDGTAHNYDVPTAITNDNNGNIYVTGSSLGTTSLTDFVTMQLNASNGQINWVKSYNYANMYEIPVSILINSNGNIYVTGASASSINNWDIATIEYDPSGNLINQDRNTSVSNGFDKPTDMRRDANGNIYIVGRAIGANANFDIKLIKLNSSLAVQWIKTFDGQGLNDEASSIEIDNNGNIIIAGYVQKPIGGKEYIIIKYDTNGNLLWQQEKDFSSDNGDNIVKDLTIDLAGNIFVTGETYDNGNSKIETIKLDQNGSDIWNKEFDQTGVDEAKNITVDSDGNIYIVAKSESTYTTQTENVVIKYRTTSFPEIPFSINGENVCSANKIIVKFNPKILNKNAIDNNGNPRENNFGSISTFVKSQYQSQIVNALGTENVILVKIFPTLKTTDTIAFSRQGKEVNVPDFWTAFMIVYPNAIDILSKLQTLNSLKTNIEYADPNFYIFNSSFNNSPCNSSPNDLFFNPEQLSLYDTVAGINIIPAWCIETGKQNIRVGVFDGEVQIRHPDLCKTPNDYNSTYIKGYDFLKSAKIPSQALFSGTGGNYGSNHGTAIAGVIGAKRNNNSIGIAGIAGGDYLNYDWINESGVKVYSMQVQEMVNISDTAGSMFYIYDAVVSSSIQDSNGLYNFGFHIMNNSWRISNGNTSTLFLDTNINLLNDCYHFANRLGVINVCGRGNEGNTATVYPALLDSTWIICVSGTQINGNYDSAHPPLDMNAASYGGGVDIAAPSALGIAYTTVDNSLYSTYGGTSIATPHVSGVAALLLSYCDDTLPSSNNLAPEDVEYIICRSATDNNAPGYDQYSGYGRLNAGEALKYVEKPFNNIYHFSSNTNAYTKTVISTLIDTTIFIESNYKQYNDTNFLHRGYYKADVYKVSMNIQHSLSPNDSIKAIFPRHSNSTFFNNININYQLTPHEHITLHSYSNTNAILEGYIYKIYDLNDNFIGWYPYDTSAVELNMAYTVISKNLIADITEIDNKKNLQAMLYPNISNGNTTIQITGGSYSNLYVTISNTIGQQIFIEHFENKNVIPMYFNNLTNGIYFINISNGKENRTLKFIKQ